MVLSSRQQRSDWANGLAEDLDVFGLERSPKFGFLFEAAVAVAIHDAVRDLPVRIFTTKERIDGIEFDFFLIGPANRLAVVEVKAAPGLPDSVHQKARNAREVAEYQRKVAAEKNPTPPRKPPTGVVSEQQHNAQAGIARRLQGGPARVLYALPGHVAENQVQRISRLAHAEVLPSWSDRAAIRACLARAVGL